MGERGSIAIKGTDGPVLFRHWGGFEEDMLELAERLKQAVEEHKHTPIGEGGAGGSNGGIISDPYTRGDAEAIFALLTKLAVESDGYSAYVGSSTSDGDNSDHGHYEIDPVTFEVEHKGG